KQYCGATGQVDNCQVGVFLSYVTTAGHALIDRELYLPEDWCIDAARRQAVHIPQTVCFQTKPELAKLMVQRAQSASLPIHWLVMRRCLDAPFEKAYYLVFAPLGTSLHTMVLAIGARWSIEVDLENAKDLGLDQYEVRNYLGWYRHMTLVMLAAAFLLSICV